MQSEDVEAVIQQLDWIGKDAITETLRALLAERDAAFAVGQAEMRERAADAALYLCRMKGMGERVIDGPEAAHLIRALPINPNP